MSDDIIGDINRAVSATENRQDNEIWVTVSDTDQVYGIIRNGDEGVVK